MIDAFPSDHWIIVPLLMMVLHCAIGLRAALLARKQGRPFKSWIVWGLIGGTAALVIVVLGKPKSDR